MSFRTDDPAVLRRRAKAMRRIWKAIDGGASVGEVEDLLVELCSGRNPDVLDRAAETLEVIHRQPSERERTFLQLLADNRQLRIALAGVNQLITITHVPADKKARVKELVDRALRVVQPIGEGRVVLAIEVLPDQTRADVDKQVGEALDGFFATKPLKGSMAGAAVVDDVKPTGGSE